MPLPMQGDKLLPGHKNIVRRGRRLGPPDRGGGDRLGDPLHGLGKMAPGEFRPQRFGIESRGMGRDIDQCALEPLGIGMAEFERGELLEMIVQQPRVVERRQQDQRLAPGDRRAVAAMHRA